LKIPKRIQPLVEEGIVDEVVGQLKSGKEATVYVVRCGDEIRCAKVYKLTEERSFRQSAKYTEGRKVKNSRRARAMEKGSRYGRKEQSEAWQSAEADALRRLARAGVRVPKPYNFLDGVLVMEMVADEEGNAAPRLNDLELAPDVAREYHRFLVMEVVRMLCVGIIHGDLSEYNVLVSRDGPVIIDLPQAVDAAGNNSAEGLLERDVDNLTAYFGRFAPELRTTDYGKEIWALYESGELHPDVKLTGRFARVEPPPDVRGVMREIDDVIKEETARQRHKAMLDS
jgi:RIO kinase 1